MDAAAPSSVITSRRSAPARTTGLSVAWLVWRGGGRFVMVSKVLHELFRNRHKVVATVKH
jgi:hypothetical protein